MTPAPGSRTCSSRWGPRPRWPATGSCTPWPRSWSTNSSKPPTTRSCPRPSPATAASTCCSRSSPNARRRTPSRSTFTDPRLCAAIVDRLTFGGNIIEAGTDSYRLPQPGPHRQRRRQLIPLLRPG
ncbi:hypothetical protein BJF78_04360 [Pseudonocardia sp. CNS-139]|nr:hypothetical protein BJF78_04360 [Pseudonocardia sp. CNS-139]